MKGVADRDSMMQDMLAKAGPPAQAAPAQEPNDPKALIDSAIEQIAAYAENPDQVTPETIQQLIEMLQQASAALGGGEEAEAAPPMMQAPMGQ